MGLLAPNKNRSTVSEKIQWMVSVNIERSPAKTRIEILDWLSPINFFLRQADISRTRQAGTGEWLLADSRFRKWESGTEGALWCRGIRARLVFCYLTNVQH